MGQMYQSIVKQYFSVEVTHNLGIALMNNTPPKNFPVDFINRSIEQIEHRTD